LLHLVDASSDAVLADVQVVEAELLAYGNGLAERPRLLVLNKIELLEASTLDALCQHLSRECGRPVIPVSAATSANLNSLLMAVWQQLGLLDASLLNDSAAVVKQ
jgi:GTP-binding protein